MKPGPKKRRPDVLIYILLAAVTVIVYWPVHGFEFLNFDDPAYVSANPHVFRGLTGEDVAWAFKSYDTNWHPVTWLSHILDCQLFGHDAGLHHLMNLLFHTANSLLLFALFRRMTGAVFRSAMVAALFALHPLHVESVAWIAERKDVLSTFFGLLALLTYVIYTAQAKAKKPKPALWYCLTSIFFALSLMSKPMLVTFPFLLSLIDFWPLQRLRIPVKKQVLEKLPFLVLSIADCVITVIAQKSGEAVVDAVKLPLSERVTNAAVAYTGYLRKMFLPMDLAPYYPYRHDLPVIEIVVAMLVLAVISAFAIVTARRRPYLLFGWLWYLGVLVPVIGLVQVGAQSMADRYTYLSLTGIFVMCVWGAAELLAGLKEKEKMGWAASAIVLIACAGGTWFQDGFWHDSETLFRRDLILEPKNNAMAHHCLGRALLDRGAVAEALSHLEEVVRLLPDFSAGHLNLANCLNSEGKFSEAMVHYQEAMRLKPNDPEIYKCLGNALAGQMKLEEARANLLTAIKLKPDYVEAYTRLATTEMAMGRTDDALKHLNDAVTLYPDYAEAQYFLAHVLQDQKKFEEAAGHFRTAIKSNPAYADAMNDLARMWLTQPGGGHANIDEAIAMASRACELTQSNNAAFLETLAAVYSEAGQFPRAVETAEKALAVASAAGDHDSAAALQKELGAYRMGRSYSAAGQ